MTPVIYRSYVICATPIGYEFFHEDFDGAPMNVGEGPHDKRHGGSPTITGCREEIDTIIEEEDDA